jgi:hypothetical protein
VKGFWDFFMAGAAGQEKRKGNERYWKADGTLTPD